MSDELSSTDDVTTTGPIPGLLGPNDLQVVEYEPAPEGPAPVDPVVGTADPVTDESPRNLLVADAKNRAWRSLLQGGVVAVLGSVATVVATVLQNGDAASVDWKMLGGMVLTAVGTAGASYVHKMLGE